MELRSYWLGNNPGLSYDSINSQLYQLQLWLKNISKVKTAHRIRVQTLWEYTRSYDIDNPGITQKSLKRWTCHFQVSRNFTWNIKQTCSGPQSSSWYLANFIWCFHDVTQRSSLLRVLDKKKNNYRSSTYGFPVVSNDMDFQSHDSPNCQFV